MDGNVELVGKSDARAIENGERPDPEWIRGTCPLCGDDVVSNCYYIGSKGYILVWECWSSLGAASERTCDYHRVL